MHESMPAESPAATADLGLLALRLAFGGLLAGHGAQKLFGAFGGQGIAGMAGWLESIGFTPGSTWARLAGLSEFGGGVLTALGLFHPLGPIATTGAMTIAALDVHGGKPIWATAGGAELPVLNLTSAAALTLLGPGAFSLDHAFGIRTPKALTALALLGLGYGLLMAETRTKPTPAVDPGPGADAAGDDA